MSVNISTRNGPVCPIGLRRRHTLCSHNLCSMSRYGVARAVVDRMGVTRSGRRKPRWMAAVAVAVALVGHALLMAGGGHPLVAAARDLPIPVTAPVHRSASHAPAIAPDVRHTPRAMHGGARSPIAVVRADETVVEQAPASNHPPGYRTVVCSELFALAWPQPQPCRPTHAGPAPAPLTVDVIVRPAAERGAIMNRLDPTMPSSARRALLQIYRI